MSAHKRVLPTSPSEIDTLFEELAKESDRACAVLAGSYLDVALETLLGAYLVDGGAIAGRRPVLEGSLSSFGNRVDVAYSIGMISREELADLHVLNTVRNMFAHQLSGLSFDAPGVESQCLKLKAVEIPPMAISPRLRFLMVAALIALAIETRIDSLTPATELALKNWPLATDTQTDRARDA